MKKTIENNTISNEMKQILDELKSSFQNNKEVTEDVVMKMKDLRELYKEIEQPTMVKSIRLTYEHLMNYGTLDNLTYWETEEIELDDECTSIGYYFDLLYKPFNKYNREEIKEMNILLKEMAE
ncbi:MAG: hypothetical protein MK207_09965 [Saprospiraceae bacterium]|nr:hypothetical protein [Saprospiraceae bacterium]